jgi:hypothetical protein
VHLRRNLVGVFDADVHEACLGESVEVFLLRQCADDTPREATALERWEWKSESCRNRTEGNCGPAARVMFMLNAQSSCKHQLRASTAVLQTGHTQ